jgi:hypothetical protein
MIIEGYSITGLPGTIMTDAQVGRRPATFIAKA